MGQSDSRIGIHATGNLPSGVHTECVLAGVSYHAPPGSSKLSALAATEVAKLRTLEWPVAFEAVGVAIQLAGAYSGLRQQTRQFLTAIETSPERSQAAEKEMAERHLIPAAHGAGLRLKRGEQLRVIDSEGGQSGDLIAFSQDGRQRLSNGRTFDYGGKIYVSTGDVLWSDRSNPMLTIVSDEVGRHDLLYAPCSIEMYRIQYGVSGYHANCHDNLCSALRELGIEPEPLPTALNFFMNVEVAVDGRLSFSPPRSRAGDSMVLRAEMDLAIALSSCPASTCNGGQPPRPLAFEIISD